MGAIFKGLIFTNHALERMKERRLSKGDVWATWKNPDSSRYSKSKNGWIYERKYNHKQIEVVAKKNEKEQWLVVSAWSKMVNQKRKHPKNYKLRILLYQIILITTTYILYLFFMARLVTQNSCLSAYHTKIYEFNDCQLSTISNIFLGLGFIGYILLNLFSYFLTKKFYKLFLASIILIIVLVASYYMFVNIYAPQLFTAPIYLDTVK